MAGQRISVCIAVVCVFASITLRAQSGSATGASSGAGASAVPRLIKFSGEINLQSKDREAINKQPATLVTATFSLFELQDGGSPLWSESQTFQLDEQGRYTVLLGATQAGGLPLDLFTSGKALWLGVQPQLPGAVEQSRVLLVAVPYALKASDSDSLGGKPASAYALAVAAPLIAGIAGGNQQPTTDNRPTTDNPQPAADNQQPTTACSAVTSDGTATANYVAKFTGACNIQQSLLFDNGTNVGVGTNAPAAFLDVQSTLAVTASGFNYGLRSLTTANPAANSSASFFSLFANAQTESGNTQNFFNLYGMDFRTDHYGTGTMNGAYGGFGAVLNHAAGTINNAYGLYTYLSNGGTGKIANSYGLYLAPPLNTGGGAFSNYVGVYIANPTAVVPKAFGVYSAGGTNYFGGNVGVGTASPASALEVAGNLKVSGSGHVIIYPDGTTQAKAARAGSGTVTSVGSGAGLAGGPITGSGSLSVAAAGVTDAMLASAYAGTASCPAGQFAVSLGRAAAPGCAAGNPGTVSSVGSGAGLTGGPITTSGTLGIATGGVTNAMLANPSLTVNAGSGLSGGGSLSLGGSGSLSIASGGVTDNMLVNPSLTVTAGGGLGGGGAVALGGTVTLTNSGILSVGAGAPIKTTGGATPTLSIATGGVTDALLANPYSGVGSCGANKVIATLARNAPPTCVLAGTVTSVASGAGLTGGPITSSGTLSIPAGGVTDAMLSNAYSGTGSCPAGEFVAGVARTATPACVAATVGTIAGVTAGTDLTGGGTAGIVTLNLDTTKVPQLIANNSFTGNESVTGNLSIVDSAVGDTAVPVLAGGVSSANTGISGTAGGPGGVGVLGDAESGSAAIGVWGMSSSGYAGEFTGNVKVTGAVTAAVKDFKIDDPIDPANKYMYHASVESSEMENIYSGNVTLDGKGEATVEVPAWLEALNRDFRYKLTCIGGFAPVYIAQEIGHGQFKVGGGKPGMKVSWQVTGVRQDAFARAHPLQVEVEKPENERGYYIHPELYGAGNEKSIQWANHPEQMRKLAEQQAKTVESKRQ